MLITDLVINDEPFSTLAFFPAYDQVRLTLGEFSPSYPTFDDDFKLVAFICGSDYLLL